MSRSTVATLIAASLVLGIFTGPFILPQLAGPLLSPVSNPDEEFSQKNQHAIRLLTENHISKEDLKEANARADDAQAKLDLLEAKIKNKEQEIEDIKTLLLSEQNNSASSARRVKILVYQIEALKRSLAEEKASIAKLLEQLNSKDELLKIKTQQITHLQEQLNAITIPDYQETTSSAVMSVPPPLVFPGHSHYVSAASFSPDNRLLVSGSWDTTLLVWDVEKRGNPISLKGHGDSVQDIAFSPDGKLILSASADKTLKLWRVEDLEELKTLDEHWHSVLACAFSPDGNFILSGGMGRRLILWDTRTGEELWDTKDKGSEKSQALTGEVRDVAFSPDGRQFLSASGHNIILWNLENGRGYENAVLKDHTGDVYTATFSRDGAYIVSGSEDKTLKIWDLKTGQAVTTLSGHDGTIHSAAFHPMASMSSRRAKTER